MTEASVLSPRLELNPAYVGNVLIDNMPPLPDFDVARSELWSMPEFRPNGFERRPLWSRVEQLEVMEQVFVPLDMHVESFMKTLRVIRASLAIRDPRNPLVMRRIYEMAELGRGVGLSRQGSGGGGAIGMTLVAVTGAGKTSFLDRLENFLTPNAPFIENIGGRACHQRQILSVRVQCPPKASLQAMGEAILQKIDEILGSVSHSAGIRNLPLSKLLLRVTAVCSSYFVGILIVDDVHNLPQGHVQTQEMLNFFCNFIEVTGIPLLLAGSLRLETLLASDIKSLSKLTAKGTLRFDRLQADSDDWAMLCQAYWSFSIADFAPEMPPSLPGLVFFHTQGVPRWLRIMMTHIHARMADGTVGFSSTLLDSIAGNEMRGLQEAISVLRRDGEGRVSPSEAAEYEDLLPSPAVAKVLRDAIQRRDSLEKAAAKASNAASAEEVLVAAHGAAQSATRPMQEPVEGDECGQASQGKGRKARKPKAKQEKSVAWLIAHAAFPYAEAKARGWIGKSLLPSKP